MACASQSALDYVQSARDHLVRTLEGFTEIVENLNQKGFFSEEEVSKIKTEGDDFKKTGIIVDSVIKKGEEACYEFLRIIDRTRKKSGERPPSFLENAELPSSPCNTFDLNYWISCFSFKEDVNMDVTYSQDPEPCHRYQLKLKPEAQKISERSWTQSKAVLFNKQSSLSYTSLVLDTQGQASPSKIKKSKIKKSRKLRPKKLKTYIPENKPGTSPDELLKSYEKNILLVGKPGVGKTAVVHQILKLWSEKDNKDLDYMFYFDMRETPTITEVHKLEDLLFGVFSEPDEGKDEVLEDIKKNADSVTIIFDGVTDVPSTSVVLELIQKTLLPEAKIIITCRPEVESADFLLDWDCLRVEVKGFSEQGIREYLSKNLSEEHLNQVLCNLELFTLCHVPMYALMVAACFSFEGSDVSPHPCTVTEIYLNILHICIQKNVCRRSENERIQCSAILSLAEAAFCATEEKNENIKSLPQLDSCVHLSFLNTLLIQVGPTVKKPLCAFLHYTVQEFFAALWVLKDPERTRGFLQQCLTEDTKHMRHLVPFLCGLLNEKNTDLLESLIPSQQLRDTSDWFFKDLVNTFVDRSEDREIDLVFLCQCLYESQSVEACLCLLDKLDYCLDLSGETLDPQCCCAVSYVISQSEEKKRRGETVISECCCYVSYVISYSKEWKIQLNLEDATVSNQGLRSLLGCLNRLQRNYSLSQQLWTLCLLSEGEVDYRSLLCFAENQLHLPVSSERQLYERAVDVLQKSAEKVNVCLHGDWRVCQHVSEVLLQCLPNIHSLSLCRSSGNLSDQTEFLMNLIIGAAEREQQTGENILNMLSSVCSHPTFPLHDDDDNNDGINISPNKYRLDFLLDLCSRVKDYETQTGRSVLPSLQSVFQSAPAVWSIKLSETKTSILLEVLKLQSEKKAVKLIGCSDEESEVRSFLQCVPYISQLSFCRSSGNLSDQTEFLMNLFIGAAEREQQTGEKILNMLSSVCSHPTFPLHEDNDNDDDINSSPNKYRLDFLLDLYSHLKDYETQTGRSVLPSLQSVFQSAPAVWSIKLSETKTSILLEVLKLQSEKKAVKLIGCSDEESEVRSFLQCVPYISQLSFCRWPSGNLSNQTEFFINLFIEAAETEQQTGEKILKKLSSVCREESFSLFNPAGRFYNNADFPCEFLFNLYSHVKDYETQTGRSVLPSLQSVFQSAPAVWPIKLSETNISILLEVLKLQSEKKPVELYGCSDEESEVRSFLQCVPYISQLRFSHSSGNLSDQIKLFTNLIIQAAEREQQTGEKIFKMLSSVCSYQGFPLHDCYDVKYRLDFLLDLCSCLKDYETQTGRSVLPSLQSVFQSAPAVWSIKLSERKTSILLEVLKLQSEKKPVQLIGRSDEESEVRSFLQCVPYISQLSFCRSSGNLSDQTEFLMNLFIGAAETEQQTGEKILNMLSSVCSHQTFPLQRDCDHRYRSDFLLDLCSRVKDYETQTGRSVLPSLQSVFQSAPAVWSIKLSETKTSILLEVLKLQSEKKPVELVECSDEESEVRSFLQCVPYISQLSFCRSSGNLSDQTEFLMNLFIGAAETEQQTGEKILNMLSSVCSHQTFPLQRDCDHRYRSDFLLDLCSRVKDYETQTGRSVLPSLQSVFQSAPAVWSIKLSETKTSILLEVLKLQSEKKPVELVECSDEESEVRSFLQCVPYISQLSFCRSSVNLSDQTEFLMNLIIGAAEREQQTGEKILNMLSSVCSHQTFPLYCTYDEKYCLDFLLDLYSHLKDYETQTGRSVLPSLQSVFQSAPAFWFIDLFYRKTSILLEVLKLQSEKKAVKLYGCSYEESEVRSFLQCVPYISQLSFSCWSSDVLDQIKFLMNLIIGAAEREQQTGEKILNMLSSVCSYKKFPFREDYVTEATIQRQSDFLLDLYSHVKDYETQTGRSVLPSLQSVFQSAPFVWFINLSDRKASILLEVLKLQSEKKQVELDGCSYEESEVRSFLQFLPYISQLSFYCYSEYISNQTKFLMNLFIGAAEREQQTGEKILNMLSSVCSSPTFPLHDEYNHRYQCDFLLDLYSRVKDYETQTGRSVLPSLQSVLSVPALWFIDLSETKTSILLEVLKLQSEKKPVQLVECSDEESEERSFLQCVPYISQLSFCWSSEDLSDQTEFLMNLIIGAAEREQQTGERILNMLSSVCSHPTFPLHFDIDDDDVDDDVHEYRLYFLCDLYSRVKDYETQTGRSVLPSLQSVFQSAPAVWSIKLSETKTFILLEVLKLQSEKKAVKLIGCSDEESEVRSFLQCVPYISQLSCDPGFFQSVCTSFAVTSEQEVQQMSSLLQLLDFNLLLTGWLSSETCTFVGRVLGLCGSKVNLSLTCRKISVRGASLLFKHTSHIRSLQLSSDLVLLLLQWVRTSEVSPSLIIEELSVIESMTYQSEKVLLSIVSSVASLLSSWTVRQLDLSELCIPTQHLTALLRHHGSLTIRVNKENLQQLPALLHEIQDQELTQCFFGKVGGDLTSCFLDWEVLYFLLQHSSGQTITVNLMKISSVEENFSHLLPFLDRVVFKRPSPSFVLSAIRHIHEAHSSHSVPSLLRSLDHVISLTCTELDSVDFSALLFILHHSDGVKLNLLWTSIPAENMESLLFTLDKVSQLSVDRTLLLRLVHCCAAAQQRASSVLLGALQHRLDLSCSSFMDLAEEEQREALRLTAADCWAISTILGYSSQETQLDLRDCEVGENGLDALLPVLDRVRLRASKALLLQLVSLITQQSQRVRWAESLWRALDGELDLSHTTLDQGTCSSLAQVLDSSEGLTELDLSHCQLTDQLLSMLIPQLHKVKVLDLSHNNLTDVSTNMLLCLTSISPFIHTVRVFGNSIEDKRPFTDKRFEI